MICLFARVYTQTYYALNSSGSYETDGSSRQMIRGARIKDANRAMFSFILVSDFDTSPSVKRFFEALGFISGFNFCELYAM